MNVCMSCLKVWDSYYLDINYSSYLIVTCPKCDGRVVEVDELMTPTIIELNKKGWKTTFCCSGHLYNNGDKLGVYISFEGKVIPPNLPENFIAESNGAIYHKTQKFNNSNRPNQLKRFQQLFNLNMELYEWSLNLPYKKEEQG